MNFQTWGTMMMRNVSEQEQAGLVLLVCLLGSGAILAIGILIRALGV